MSETRSRGRVAVVASGVVVCLVAVVSLYFGAAHIPPWEIVRALVSRTPLLGNLFLSEAWAGSLADASVAILVDVRLPRVLLAGLVGAALAASGVVTQAVFRCQQCGYETHADLNGGHNIALKWLNRPSTNKASTLKTT